MNTDAIDSLLRALRRRIWLEKSLLRLRAATWAASLVLLAVALVSVFAIPVPAGYAVIVAAVVFAGVMLSAIVLRPSLEACARRADRRFGNDALLTTALELKQVSEHSAAARVVLHQAASSTPASGKQLGAAWRTPAPSGFVLAIVPVFAAVLLLSYSAVNTEHMATSGAQADPTPTNEYVLDDADDLRALRDSIVRSTTERNGQAGVTRVTDDTAAKTGAGEVRGTPQQGSEEDMSALSSMVDGPGGGREAGDSMPDRALPQKSATAAAFSELTVTQLERRGDAMAGSLDSGTGYASAPEIVGSRTARAAAAPASLTSWSILSPAQVAYARRFLETTESPRD